MLIFTIMLVTMMIGVIVVRHIDQQRWDRYQFDRAKFFQTYPYDFRSDQQYSIQIPISASNQLRLINTLMLKSVEPILYLDALIQRMDTHHSQPHQVQVSIADIRVGYLEMSYARLFTQALAHTDFYVGRPIRVMAEIMLKEASSSKNCQVRLDLFRDPAQADQFLKEPCHEY